MLQKFEEVIVQGVAGPSNVLGLVRIRGKVAYVCSLDRCHAGSPAEIEDWLVGFPVSDVRRANDGGPLRAA